MDRITKNSMKTEHSFLKPLIQGTKYCFGLTKESAVDLTGILASIMDTSSFLMLLLFTMSVSSP